MAVTLGIVVIGRNEGERLRRCLLTARGSDHPVVYVDSGSIDRSTDLARSMGIEVVELDSAIPFTAARARNAGFEFLTRHHPELEFIQFVDGDCEISAGWLRRACDFLRNHPHAAIAWGRRREQFPFASIYNALCDIEWNAPVGETTWCGGDAFMRAAAFTQVGGFDPALIAGEEPELCLRLRENKWTIHRIDADVTLHDANLMRFGQWWRRTIRTGHTFAQGAHRYGSRPDRYCVRETWSSMVWGLLLPASALILAWPSRGLSVLAAIALYAILFVRILRSVRGENRSDLPGPWHAAWYAAFTVLGKVPQAIGGLRYWFMHIRRRHAPLIEYKLPAESKTAP